MENVETVTAPDMEIHLEDEWYLSTADSLFHQVSQFMAENLTLPQKIEDYTIPCRKDEWHDQLIDRSVIPCTQIGLALCAEFLKNLHLARLALEKYADEIKYVREENRILREGLVYNDKLQALTGDLLDVSKAYVKNDLGLIVPTVCEEADNKKELNAVEKILTRPRYGEEAKEDPHYSVLTFSRLEKDNSSYFPNGSLSFSNTEREFYTYLPARYRSDAGVFVTAEKSKLDDNLKILIKQVQLAVNEYAEHTTNNFYDASERNRLRHTKDPKTGEIEKLDGWEKRTLNVVIKGLEEGRKHTDKQLIFLLDNDKVEEEFKILYRTAMQERVPTTLRV